jgi:hypothetical protein
MGERYVRYGYGMDTLYVCMIRRSEMILLRAVVLVVVVHMNVCVMVCFHFIVSMSSDLSNI